jgi:hypothetical protein
MSLSRPSLAAVKSVAYVPSYSQREYNV